jgi:hypothetical protein
MIIRANGEKLPQTFYSKYAAWLRSGDLGGLLHKMQTLDLAGFEAGADAPRTSAREEMVAVGRSQIQEWARELRINTDTALAVGNVTASGMFFTTAELLPFFNRGEITRVTEKALALALRAEGFTLANDGGLIRIPGTDLRHRLWIVRDKLKAANMSAGQIGDAYARQIGSLRGGKTGTR